MFSACSNAPIFTDKIKKIIIINLPLVKISPYSRGLVQVIQYNPGKKMFDHFNIEFLSMTGLQS